MPTVSRSTAFALLSVVLVVLVLAGQRLVRTGAAQAPDATAPVQPASTTPTVSALVVHVVGAVRRPGLYRLGEGKRVADAVARAGGATRRADLTALNLAAPLVDGTQVLVPGMAAVACAGASGSPAEADGLSPAASSGTGTKVSLSTATAEQLDALPGVGPVTAQRILDYRAEHGPFGSVDDLDAVPGIGPTRIDELRDLVTP